MAVDSYEKNTFFENSKLSEKSYPHDNQQDAYSETPDVIEEIEALESAEDFLRYFAIEYDAALVQVKHIQLLRMYQKFLPGDNPEPGYADHKQALCMAYKQLAHGRTLAFAASGCQSCSSDCG